MIEDGVIVQNVIAQAVMQANCKNDEPAAVRTDKVIFRGRFRLIDVLQVS